MKVGEFISTELEELLARQDRLARTYKTYCTKHNKEFSSRICFSITDPILFTLEIIIKDGDNGEIKSN